MTRQRVGTTRTDAAAPRRHRPDYQIVLFMGILVLLGLVVLFAISPARVQLINEGGGTLDQAHFMQKQVVYLVAGLSAFVAASMLPLTFWKRYTDKILLLGFALCLLLAFLGLFLNGGIIIETGGATRWFNLGVSSFQPAELLKFGLLLFTAGFLGRRVQQGKINSLHDTLIPVGILVAAASMFIIVFQKDLGTGITMLGMLASMLFVAGLSGRLLALSIGALFAATALLIVTSPHRIDRVVTFFNPATAEASSSYHINQAAIALGTGGLTGKGLGNSVQAFGYLPEAVNDSIFAILGETFGFIGLIAILAVFFALLRRVLLTMDKTIDPTLRLIVAGVFGLITTHVVVNVGAMTGVFPLTGVTLPFLSFGGTSLLFTMISLGLVFHISRYTTHQQIKEAPHESAQRGRGLGWSRDTRTRRYQRT